MMLMIYTLHIMYMMCLKVVRDKITAILRDGHDSSTAKLFKDANGKVTNYTNNESMTSKAS